MRPNMFSPELDTPAAADLPKFPPRVRFNWGFWDGVADRETGFRDRRNIPQGTIFCLPKDRVYRDGYEAGRGTTYRGEDSSEHAWLDR